METILKKRNPLIIAGITATLFFLIFVSFSPLLSLAAAVGLLVFIVSLKFKEHVFYAFILMYPLIPRYMAFDLGGSLPLLTAGRFMIFYVLAFDLVVNREKLRNVRKELFSRDVKLLTYSVIILIAAYFINFFSFLNVESFKIFSSFLLENILVGVYIFARLTSKEEVSKTIKYFLIAATIIGIAGLIEFFMQENIFSYLDIVQSDRQLLSSDTYIRLGRGRVEGPFGHPLAYCNFLLMAVPLSIYKWQACSNIKKKTGYFFITLLLLINFFLTLSRGPMLALLAGLFIYFIFTCTGNKQKIFMIGVSLLALLALSIAIGAAPNFIRNFILSIIDSVMMRGSGGSFGGNSNASVYRLYLFDLARKLVTGGEIWIGRGMSFFRLNEVYDWVPGISRNREVRVVSVDNYYILKYIEMGVLGLASNLFFIFSLICSCAAKFFRTADRELMLSFLFITISYFVSLFTVDEIGTMNFMWIIIGIIAARISLREYAGRSIRERTNF